MAKTLNKTSATSTADSQQKEQLWTLARQFGPPVYAPADFQKICAETANPICVPERLFVYASDSQLSVLTQKPKRQAPRFVLIIVLKGVCQMCVDERIFTLDLDQAFLIFPFQFRHWISQQEKSIRWICISFEMARADSFESLHNQPWDVTPELTQTLHHLLEAASSRNPTGTRRGPEAQLWLAHFLSQSSTQKIRLPSSSPMVFTESQKLLERINGYLSRHLDQPFKLSDMARGIGCSKDHLAHQFKEHFKVSPGHYVAQMRLSRAAMLLRKNMLNISGVAQACGYGSSYAFSRAFHATMGCSPRDYRSQFNKGNAER